jgi:hypothetical protein
MCRRLLAGGDGGSHGGKLVTSILMLTSLPVAPMVRLGPLCDSEFLCAMLMRWMRAGTVACALLRARVVSVPAMPRARSVRAGIRDSIVWQGSAWLGKGLLELGGSFGGSFNFLPSTGAEVERLRDLIQCARVLMRDEDTKRLSLSLHRQRLSLRETDVA